MIVADYMLHAQIAGSCINKLEIKQESLYFPVIDFRFVRETHQNTFSPSIFIEALPRNCGSGKVDKALLHAHAFVEAYLIGIYRSKINVRLETLMVQKLDDARREQSDLPSRPEMIRRILQVWASDKDST